MGAVLQEVIPVSGSYVAEDGVDGGSFACSHLLDRGEEHDTHSCTENNRNTSIKAQGNGSRG